MDKLKQQEFAALDLVKEYFTGRLDKGNHAYEGHLFRVAGAIEKEWKISTHDKESSLYAFYHKAYIVALLHDLLEDTNCTVDRLVQIGFDDEIIKAIQAITRRKDEQYYFDFIERVKMNDIARKVKIYDLEDNMDIRRLGTLENKDLNRTKKYWYCWRYLQGHITSLTCNNAIHPDRKWR